MNPAPPLRLLTPNAPLAGDSTSSGSDQLRRLATTGITALLTEATTSVSDLVEKCLVEAEAERELAIEQARAESAAEMRRLEDVVGGLKAESQSARDELKIAREALEAEHGARVRAETACQDAQAAAGEVASTLNAQLHAAQIELESERARSVQLQQQIEIEKAERVKLVDALRAVQRAVSFEDPAGPKPPATPPRRKADFQDREPAGQADSDVGHHAIETAVEAPSAEAQAHKELVAYVERLFVDIEKMYWADLGSGKNATEVVERLLANLTYAHEAVARHGGPAGSEASALFQSQMMTLIDAKPETSFARHLGIAAYEYSMAVEAAKRPVAEAS